jgi:GNAT superfamily N-acetyltransferase
MKTDWTITPAAATDEAEILACTQATGVFSGAEVATVAELFAGYLDDPQVSGYNFLVCRDVAYLYGFACWGPTDLTAGTADLYWICTHPDAQGRGVARALFQAVESAVRAIGRWQIMIWTSSKPEYLPAQRFYTQMHCRLVAQIPDYYAIGDDLCIYVLRLGETS